MTSKKNDLNIFDVPDSEIPKPDYPGQAVAYWSSPKNKASALNRILGMTSGFNQGMFDKKVNEYKEKFNITGKDITKWHTREKISHDNEPSQDPNLVYGGKRKTKKRRNKCSCCAPYKCTCPKSCKKCDHNKLRKTRRSRKSRKSRKLRK